METELELTRLEERIAELKKSNEFMQNELDDIKAYTEECDSLEKIYGRLRPRGSYFGKMRNLADFKEKWCETVFWKYHNELDRLGFLTSDQMGHALIEYRDYDVFGYFMCNTVMYCEIAVPTPKGVLLHLIDPFGASDMITSIISPALISKYVGRLLRIKCMKKTEVSALQIIEIEILPYTLSKKLTTR